MSQSSSAQVHSESHGFLSHGSVSSDTSSASTTQQGSTVSGNTVAMDAGHDLGVSGSNVAGAGNVALQAGHDVTITAATNTASSSSYYEADHSGLFSRKLPRQVDNSEFETSWLNTLGRNSAGGMLPRESCGRYSL